MGSEEAVPQERVEVEVVPAQQLELALAQESGALSEAGCHDAKVGSPSTDWETEEADSEDSHTVPSPCPAQGSRQVALNDAIARRPDPYGDRSSQCQMMLRVRRDLVDHAFLAQRDYPDIRRDRRAASS